MYAQNLGWTSVYGNKDGAGTFGDIRLPTFAELSLRVGADGFNVFNSATPSLISSPFRLRPEGLFL